MPTIKFSSSLQPPQILPSYQLLHLLCYRACSASQNLDVRIVELNKALESPLDSKEIKPVNPKGNQPWIFIGRTDAEAPITWPPHTKSWLTGKDSDTGKDWGQEEKGATEDEMVRWHHQLNGHEFEQSPGDNEGQGSLVCYSPRDPKESEATEWVNNSNKAFLLYSGH